MAILIGVMLLMTLLASAMIIGPLIAKQKSVISQQDVSRNAVNSVVFKDRLHELQLDVDTNTISQEEFEQLKTELEMGLLSDVPDAEEGADSQTLSGQSKNTSGILATIAILIVVPSLSLGFYYQGGQAPEVQNWLQLRQDMEPVFSALMAGEKPQTNDSKRTVVDFVTALQRKAQEQPDDANIWHMLGMGYLQMQAGEQAEQALRRAYRIEPDNPRYQLALAQLLVGMDQGKLNAESEALLVGVLNKDPVNMQALSMLGMGEFFAERFKRSLMYWERLLAVSTASNASQEKIDILNRSIAFAKQRIAEAEDTTNIEPTSTVQLQVKVDIDPALKKQLSETDTLFIYAQKSEGPKIPLAAIKKAAEDFPVTVTLSDKQAMMPQYRLSSAARVIVKARVSSSNNAIPESGDFVGQSEVIEIETIKNQQKTIQVAINTTVP